MGERLACLDPRNGLLLAPKTRESQQINPKLYNSKTGRCWGRGSHAYTRETGYCWHLPQEIVNG